MGYRISNSIVNPAYLFLGMIILFGIVLIINAMIKAHKRFSTKEGLIISDLTQPCDNIDPGSPDITSLLCCRDFNGQITDRKYIPLYDMVVSNTPRAYLSVCTGFCLEGLDNDQKTCINLSGDSSQQSKFNQCVLLTEPKDCTGEVKPVAFQGTTRYYAYAAGESLCKNKGPCS